MTDETPAARYARHTRNAVVLIAVLLSLAMAGSVIYGLVAAHAASVACQQQGIC